MEGMFRKSLCLAVLLGTGVISADNCGNQVSPLISPRSRSVDSALELAGWANKVNLYDMEGVYGTFAITPQFARTFRANKTIIPCLFGNDINCNCDCPTLKISGRCAENRGACDWLADYFGLPQDFSSTVQFSPRVDSFSVDFNLYLGLNCWCDGLYFRIHAPVEHVRYKLGFCETICSTGTQHYPEGYMSQAAVPRSNLLSSFEAYNNCAVPNLNGFDETGFGVLGTTPITSTVVFQPLRCARMSTCNSLKETKLSDLQFAFGWNFCQDTDYHLGIEIRAAAPTGTRPCGEYLFEPIVGNGHHWELGGGVTGHICLWQNDEETAHFGFYVDANVTHMFKARQRRFFDLVNNGGNSRYMLAERLGTPVVNLFSNPLIGDVAGSTAPVAQFKDVLTPVANLTCCDVDVSIGVQGDVTAMFNYTCGGFEWDLGYNFWGRSCDKIQLDCDCPCTLESQARTWALKGDVNVYGYADALNTVGVPAFPNNAVALSATNSLSTIHSGSNEPIGTECSLIPGRRNVNADNSQFARLTAGATGEADSIEISTYNGTQTRTSNPPRFITIDDVDLCGARTRGISNKIFTHLSYTWQDTECWTPYLGIGGKAEFGPSHSCCDNDCGSNCGTGCNTGCGTGCGPCGITSTATTSSCNIGSCGTCCDTSCCDSCPKCNFSEWSVWIKGGISFD